MYNESNKRRFIDDYAGSLSTRTMVEAFFNSIEKYEIAWQADICTKSVDDLQPVVDEVVGLRIKSQMLYITILKEYVKWCLAMKIPGSRDDMLKIDSVGVGRIKRQMVSSPLHLQRYLNSIFDKESEETIDNIYRCYFWMAFSGIDEEDAFLVKSDDVDFTTLSIRYKTYTVPIYREAMPAFKNAATLNSFLYKNQNYTNPIRRDRVPGDTIMRGVRSNPKILSIRRVLSSRSVKAFEDGVTDTQLSFGRVKLSGIFYRAYERERAGFHINFKQEVLADGKSRSLSKQNQIEKEYFEDYKRWKLAFLI